MLSVFTNIAMPIVFKRWSRKNYAVFASLNKEVSIGHVDIEISDKALLKGVKNHGVSIAVNDLINPEKEDPDENLQELSEEQLLCLLTQELNSDISSRRHASINNTKQIDNLYPSQSLGCELSYFKFYKNEHII